MKSTAWFVAVVFVLLISAHRVPAPILEVASPTPEEKTAKPQTKQKAGEESEVSSAARFDGTWRYTNNNGTYTLLINNGHTAEWSSEFTDRLGNRKSWPASVLPSSYSTIPTITEKITGKTTQVRAEGSKLTINWPQGSKTIVDWSPKTLPYDALANSSLFHMKLGTELYTLNGNALVRIGRNGKPSVFVRVK